MKIAVYFSLTLSFLLTLTGCGSLTSVPSHVVQGAMIGGAAGLASGAAIGYAFGPKFAVDGALVGVGIGAVTGGVVGAWEDCKGRPAAVNTGREDLYALYGYQLGELAAARRDSYATYYGRCDGAYTDVIADGRRSLYVPSPAYGY